MNINDADLDDTHTISTFSDDTTVATVSVYDTTLSVTGKAAGIATITVTATDDSGHDNAAAIPVTFEVTVKPPSAGVTKWVGTWAVETVDGQTWEQAFAEEFGEEGVTVSIVTNDWTFNDDGTMEVEFAMKFEVKEEGLTLSGQGSMKIMGTYALSGSNYTLTPTEVEGTGLFEGEVEPVDPTDEGTGTWVRKGNTLTLNSDDGSTLVLKKK